MALQTSHPMRSVATASAGVLCIAAITCALLLGYAGRTFFHAEVFAEKAAASLAEPGVSALVATRLTDGLISQRRDLTAFRPLLLSTVESLVSSSPFRGVVRRAATVVHKTILSQAGENISLSVADAGVILQSALAATPALATRIPAGMTTILAETKEAPGAGIIVRLVRIAHNLRLGAWSLLLFGIMMGAAGFALAAHRRRFLLRIGINVAAVAVILWLTVRFGGEALSLMAKDELIAGAIAGVWHAFWGGLMTWALILGGIGLVLAAGVSSLLDRVELLAGAQAAWTWLSSSHERTSTRLLRALALLGIAVPAVLSPAFAITTLMMVAGLLVFFLGLQEFFGIVLLAVPKKDVPQTSPAARKGVSMSRILAVGLMVLLLAGAGVSYLLSREASDASTSAVIDACNGYAELCSRPFNEVALPTTHNSMSAADIPNWMFPEQEGDIPAQLKDGIRGFLFDAHYGVPAGGYVKTLLEDEAAARKKYEAVLGAEGIDAAMRIRDRLVGESEGARSVYLCHGFCELGASPLIPVLRQVRAFLVMNPNEVITFVIQDEGVTPQDIEKCFQQSGLIDFVYRGPVAPPWPTLRKMIASDQRVVVFAENNSAGVPWYHQAYESMQETPYTFHRPEDFSCRPNRGNTSNSLFLINHWIETAPAPKPSNAEIVNAYDFLLNRAQQCRRERGMLPNFVAVDFYRTGDLFKVVETLNGIHPDGGR